MLSYVLCLLYLGLVVSIVCLSRVGYSTLFPQRSCLQLPGGDFFDFSSNEILIVEKLKHLDEETMRE